MNNKNTINTYIEPIKVGGDIYDYRMYMNYNDYDYCFLWNDDNAHKLAINIKKGMPCFALETTFTDQYGIINKKDNANSFVGYVTGTDNIDDSIVPIIHACMNPDIQADLTYHLNGKDYPIVRDIDHKDYLPLGFLGAGDKGVNEDILLDLTLEIKNLDSTLITEEKRSLL